jgi:hypothetical protein
MGRPPRRGSVTIGVPRLSRVNGTARVAADVDSHEAWFETSDLPLSTVSEAFGSGFLIPSLELGARLEFAGPVDPVWLDNLAPLTAILRRWWRYPKLPPRAERRTPAERPAGRGQTALFFSGGTDSFYSLLRGRERPDRLVLVQGFDYALDDERRHAAAEQSLREVAAEAGVAAGVVRTNLREHPLFREAPWERTHGGALAAVGHALGEPIARIAISSSIAYASQRHWGSHWALDPLWASAERSFVSIGQHYRKFEKLEAIAAEPLVQRHLRVCWENHSPEGNCGRCHKCLYARVVLANCGQLHRFRTFDDESTLVSALDALPRARPRLRMYTDLLARGTLDPEIARAVRDLIARTRRANSPPARLRRAFVREVKTLLRGGRA